MYNAGLSVEVYILHRKSKAWTVFLFLLQNQKVIHYFETAFYNYLKNALRPIKQKNRM